MRTAAVILLAGSSTRFAAKSSKQFYEVNGKPLAYYAIKPFVDSENVDFVMLTYKDGDIDKINEVIRLLDSKKPIYLVLGGDTRHDSVDHALKALEGKIYPDENVLIHDGARLFLEERQIVSLIDALKEYKAATLALPMEDTIAQVSNGTLFDVPSRDLFVKIQTPQAFKFGTIRKAHQHSSANATDDAQLCLLINEKVKILEGSKKLNKVTTIEDINNVKEILNG